MTDDALDIVETSLAELVGAEEESSIQQLTLYIPNKDKNGQEVPDIRDWIKEARKLLTFIGGGATALPPADGTWLSPEKRAETFTDLKDEDVVWEKTTIIYTYIMTDSFLNSLKALRKFLHRFGKETNQGEVVFEFDGKFFRISDFDEN
ncbi:MAG: hypothetical protein GY950_32440 [bacterium]|nr:hypothetical protein [bacterium]